MAYYEIPLLLAIDQIWTIKLHSLRVILNQDRLYMILCPNIEII